MEIYIILLELRVIALFYSHKKDLSIHSTRYFIKYINSRLFCHQIQVLTRQYHFIVLVAHAELFN